MAGEPVPVTARFSNGGGEPAIPDYAKEGRGLAVKFYLPDGSKTDIVALSLPCFFVRTPEDFLDFTRLRKPDPETGQPDFEKLGEWMGRHPEAGPAIQAALSTDPPESRDRGLNSIHAFRWTAPDGTGRFVHPLRPPDDGERAKAGGSHHLRGVRRQRRPGRRPGLRISLPIRWPSFSKSGWPVSGSGLHSSVKSEKC